jgi:hypothetical protein
VVICEASNYNRGGVRKRTLLSKRYRRRPSDETEHKLRSEDELVVSGFPQHYVSFMLPFSAPA